MSEAVLLQAYPMYFYGMTKICIPDFFGGRGDTSWHLKVGFQARGLSEIFYLGTFCKNGSTDLLLVIRSFKVMKSLFVRESYLIVLPTDAPRQYGHCQSGQIQHIKNFLGMRKEGIVQVKRKTRASYPH